MALVSLLETSPALQGTAPRHGGPEVPVKPSEHLQGMPNSSLDNKYPFMLTW